MRQPGRGLPRRCRNHRARSRGERPHGASAASGSLSAALAADGALGPTPALDFRSTPSIRAWLALPDIADVALRGTATPDHVIRDKPFPLILEAGATRATIETALAAFADRYLAYSSVMPLAHLSQRPCSTSCRVRFSYPGSGCSDSGATERMRASLPTFSKTARIRPRRGGVGHPLQSDIRGRALRHGVLSLEQAKLRPAA